MSEIIYKKDGDKICATFKDFKNLQESSAGFGNTEKEAMDDLIKNDNILKAQENKYGVNIIVCEMHDEMPHEILTAKLRAKKPFTKKMIEDFIEGETTINNIKKVADAHDQEMKIIYVITNQD